MAQDCQDQESDRISKERTPLEAAFHDERPLSTRLERGSVREPFEAPTTTTNQFILQMTWPLKGKKLLDLASPLEDWDVGSNQFDLDCFGNTIHHVEDRAMLFEKIARAQIRPRVFSINPIGCSPVIDMSRREGPSSWRTCVLPEDTSARGFLGLHEVLSSGRSRCET